MRVKVAKRKRSVAGMVALMAMLVPGAFAKDAAVHWRDVAPLVVNQNVAVKLVRGKGPKGSVMAVNAESLVVATSSGREEIPRDQVQVIRVLHKPGHKWRVIGTAVGVAAAAAIAAPILTETHNEGSGRYDGAAAGVFVALPALGYFAGWSADKKGDVITILPD